MSKKWHVMIIGHEGPHDIRISDKKPTIRGLGIMHHASLATGHCYGMVEKFGKLAGIEVVRIR